MKKMLILGCLVLFFGSGGFIRLRYGSYKIYHSS
jgi:hypothetical protein